MPRTEQEQVEQVGRYVVLLRDETDRLWRRQRFLTMVLIAAAFVVPVTALIALSVEGPHAGSLVVFAGSLVSVVALLVWRMQSLMRTTHDRLFSLIIVDNAEAKIESKTQAEHQSSQADPTSATSRIMGLPPVRSEQR